MNTESKSNHNKRRSSRPAFKAGASALVVALILLFAAGSATGDGDWDVQVDAGALAGNTYLGSDETLSLPCRRSVPRAPRKTPLGSSRCPWRELGCPTETRHQV